MYEDWPTIQEATKATGISTRTLERRIKDKEIRREFRPQEGKKPVAVLNPEDLEKVIQKKEDERIHLLPKSKALTVKPPVRHTDVAGMLTALLSRPQVSLSLDKKIYHTRDEAALFLGLPKTYVKAQIEARKLPAVKVGRQWFIRRADLERHTVKPTRGSVAG